jgi:hypothetical protein
MKRIVRPSGWKIQGPWWVSPSKYGLRYMCPECGKKALGTTFRDDRHHHWSECSRMEPNKELGARKPDEST